MQFEPPAHCLNAYNAEETSASTAVVCNLSDIKDHTTGGSGLDIYGINTGIYTTHTCFSRCTSWGAVSNSYTLFWILHSFVLFNATLNQTFGGYANKDGNGHGTHTAGTAVGKMYSIATSAQIIAVKVLSDQGSGSYSDIISGVNWAYNQYKSTCCPFIAMMSLGRPMSMALDNTPKNAINGALHFTVATGNSAQDASSTSPAHVVPANTVSTSDSTNKIASFSNYGPVLDIFAPGVNIFSAWIRSTTAMLRLSGTSMSKPYVAGILAIALGKDGQMSHAKAVITGQVGMFLD